MNSFFVICLKINSGLAEIEAPYLSWKTQEKIIAFPDIDLADWLIEFLEGKNNAK